MGCNIHAFIEYRDPTNDRKEFSSFGKVIHLPKNYNLFTKIANVRGFHSEDRNPKGLPDDISWTVRCENFVYITNKTNDSELGDNECTLQQAENWNKQYDCKILYNKDGVPVLVANPEWHSHTWLTPEEWSKAIGDEVDNWDVPYAIVNDVLKSFTKRGFEARVVCWFDN